MRTALSSLGLALLLACRAAPVEEPPAPTGPQLPVTPAWTPPADWATMPPAEFEELVLTALPDGVITPIQATSRGQLEAALELQDPTSVRAAVILGRSRHVESGDVLLRRLQKRDVGPERNSDAGDVVAAAALARFPDPRRYWPIVRMAEGKTAHPDLEVRVECACTALAAGYDQVIPFLLKVLRIGTWEGQDDERDFAESTTTAWARTRAAQALSERAGVPVTYRADASVPGREREVRRLESRLP